MQLSSETPKLPKLPFFAADAALLAAAALIFNFSAKPLAAGPLVAITICVALAAVCGLLPFILDYTRERDEEIAKQQRALEALARTTAETAEQIGIAAAGLHTIAEQLKKSVTAAEHLPQQLQEKIAALDTRRAATAVAEADALRTELAAMRAAQMAKPETAIEPALPNPASRKLRAAKSPTDDKPEPVVSPAPTTTEASPPATLTTEVPPPATSVAEAPAPVAPAADTTSAEVPTPTHIAPAVTASPAPAPLAVAALPAATVAAAVAAAEAIMREIPTEEITETIAPFPMRPRPRAADTVPPLAAELTAGPEQGMLSPPPRRKRAKGQPDAANSESAGTPLLASDVPSRPGDTNPILELGISDDTPLSPEGHYPATATALTAPTAPPFPPRRAAAKPVKPPPEPPAPSPTADSAPETPAASSGDDAPATDIALTSDGLTRLIVTAYIGIGNKLFLRGDGPGLRPDIGVPLQFVSIGKWRWETTDATAPMSVQLYKNDRDPCPAPAAITLRPGHQHEVTADF